MSKLPSIEAPTVRTPVQWGVAFLTSIALLLGTSLAAGENWSCAMRISEPSIDRTNAICRPENEGLVSFLQGQNCG